MTMTKKMRNRILLGTVAAIIVGVTCFFMIPKGSHALVEYNTTPVVMGTVEETVSSTGTLDAVGTVQVGTQVSGTVATLKADYNDRVHKNQAIAILDLTTLQESLAIAAADLERAKVTAEHSANDFKRNQKLLADGHIAEKDFLDSKATHLQDSVAVISAEANKQRAQTNLELGTIRSPINGTVISRSIEVGQTVAASLSSPTLFVIAEDLTRMEILANVDESDIGRIKPGLSVRFSVQSYPDSIFIGKVTQIRLQPTTISNVVNYTVVVDAPNPTLRLLPGMTATVTFVTAVSDSSMIVPNSALSFKGPADPQLRPPPTGAKGDSLRAKWQHRDSTVANSGANKLTEANRGRVWVLLPDGTLQPKHMLLGLTDGAKTAVLKSHELQVGDLVVTSVKTATTAMKKQKTLLDNMGPGGAPPKGMR